jgi:hypothetical protein
VYEYILYPENLPEFWPSVVEVTNIQELPNGGYYGKYLYKMAGLKFEGYGECVEIVPNQWMVIETHGGIKSRITWTFRSRGDVTRITLTIEYIIPIPLLGKLAEAIIVMMNDQEAELIMANLQARFMAPGH